MILKPKIFFRADGNSTIGLGHIVRSMALADMLKDDFECIFLVQEPSDILANQIQQQFKLISLPLTTNFEKEIKQVAQTYLSNNTIIVLDHYHLQTLHQQICKDAGAKVVCIDDLNSWHFVADIIINHAGGFNVDDYSCESYTTLCLGLQYALLRKPFLEAAQKMRKTNNIEKVFICFGGADSYNFTQKAIHVCINSKKFTEIHVVVGSAYIYFDELEKYAKNNTTIFLYQNLDASQMCQVMQRCHIAIVPASSIAYECYAVGLNLFIGWYVENQKSFAYYLGKETNFEVYNFLELFTVDFTPQLLSFLDAFSNSKSHSVKKLDGLQQKRFLNLFSQLS